MQRFSRESTVQETVADFGDTALAERSRMPPPRKSACACGLAAGLALVVGAITSGGANSSARSAPAADCPWIGSNASPDQKAALVLAHMTLDEKLQIITATRPSTGIPRLCLPGVYQQGGPGGVNGNLSGVTQLPAPISLAASWDANLAKLYGGVIGAEERTKGTSLVGAPTVNVARNPLNGRTYEAYGEDPYLAGQMAAGTIQGIQSQNIMAMVKHYAAYNQESGRLSLVATVDERTMREIYLPAFETAVKLAKPAAVMCSYTRLNGTPSCANDWLNNQVLKRDWGFRGIVANDFTAQNQSTAAQDANGGLDYELPAPSRYATPLRTALASGEVSQARLDDMVLRILHSMFATGLVDKPVTGSADAIATTSAHQEIGLEVSKAGTVLLQNTDHVLPLSDRDKNILVAGPDASTYPVTSGGLSAGTVADSIVTPLAGITARAGSAHVQYVEGVEPVTPYNALLPGLPNVPQSTLSTPSGDPGIQSTFYDSSNMVLGTRTDKSINFDWNIRFVGAIYPNGRNAPPPGTTSEQWDGRFTAPGSGTYTFEIIVSGNATVTMDGKQVASVTSSGQSQWTMELAGGSTHTLRVKANVPTNGRIKLGWQPPAGVVAPAITAAADQARSADVAIVFANDYAQEGARSVNDLFNDRPSLSLPGNQNALIDAVARANPNTIVVLNTGSAVLMPWENEVKSIIESWYPGQSAGTAIASVLFGDTDPSGRLPVSFPASENDTPTAGDLTRYPGVRNQVTYSEGLDIGYRWYDARKITPLFPFGYGLSYTTYRYDHLQVMPTVVRDTKPIRVTFRLTNTGSRASTGIAQIYLSLPASTGEPPKRLVGWARVSLQPGESQSVEVTIDPNAVNHPLSYWNTATHAWTTARGAYIVMVAGSAGSIAQTETITVR
jgi:beta-glucosidase